MDKLYLGPDDDTEVNDLLAQLGDESLLKLTVNTHTSTDGVQSGLIEDPSLEPSYEGINSDLAARYASLKAPHPPATKKTSAGSKAASANKGDDYASSKRSSKPKKGDTGESSKRLSSQEIETDLNAELLARLQALKGPSHSILGADEEHVSANSTDTVADSLSLSDQMKALKRQSRKTSHPSPTTSSQPTGMAISSTSVAPTGWCAPTSPFKLIKALNVKKAEHSGPTSRSPSKGPPSDRQESTKAVKESLSREMLRGEGKEQEDPSAMVADVQRLIAAVSNDRRQDRGKDFPELTTLSGDQRTFFMKDREEEFLKAMEDEGAMNLEAEKVRFWPVNIKQLACCITYGHFAFVCAMHMLPKG
jgi:hypothetical protein